jgi:peptidoglycan/LPS O-acetylase OafA/YrhL
MQAQVVPARIKGEILPLTSFRAWAALLVVAHHDLLYEHSQIVLNGETIPLESGNPQVPWYLALIYEGRVGVTMFFALSGFLLTLRYWESLRRGVSMKEYFVKRIARIWPLFLFVCGLQFAFEVYKDHHHSDPDFFQKYIIYFTLTQGFFGEIKFLGVGTAWSLTVEECFYLLLPLLIFALRRVLPDSARVWRTLLTTAGALAMAGAILAALGLGLTLQPWIKLWGFFSTHDNHWLQYTIFGRFADFAAGMLMAFVYMRGSNALLARPLLVDAGIVACVAGILGSCYFFFYHHDSLPMGEAFHLGSVVSSALLIYLLCAPDSLFVRLNRWRGLVYLGRVSYALYLVHIVRFMIPAYRRVWWRDYHEVAEGLLCFAIALTFAIFCYEFIERPGQKLVLRWGGFGGGGSSGPGRAAEPVLTPAPSVLKRSLAAEAV